jgi:glutaredoxin-like protein NrdH
MSLANTLSYEKITGHRNGPQLRLFALSTCAFCERSLEFLKDQGFEHEYLLIDNLEPEIKRNLKKELRDLYGPIPVFPVLVINDAEILTGFTETIWRQRLGITD